MFPTLIYLFLLHFWIKTFVCFVRYFITQEKSWQKCTWSWVIPQISFDSRPQPGAPSVCGHLEFENSVWSYIDFICRTTGSSFDFIKNTSGCFPSAHLWAIKHQPIRVTRVQPYKTSQIFSCYIVEQFTPTYFYMDVSVLEHGVFLLVEEGSHAASRCCYEAELKQILPVCKIFQAERCVTNFLQSVYLT